MLFLLSVIFFFGCAQSQNSSFDREISMEEELFGEEKSAFGNVTAPENFQWRQFDGIVLNFLVENNINANILSREVDKFTEVTGIKVNIRSMDFDSMVEKLNMEFISKTDEFDLVYVDPYQTLCRFYKQLEDLNQYENHPELPHIVGGLGSFSRQQVEVCSYFQNDEELYAIPFDATTMILYYRKDIFEKYKGEMREALGYEPAPGTASFTWEQYGEVSSWLTENVPELEYGSITMSAKHNSIYTEFSNLLSAYRGDYFAKDGLSSYGDIMGGEILCDSQEFLEALKQYKSLVYRGDEKTRDLNWTDCSLLFQEGKVGMMINWDENAPVVENKKESVVAGKVGYGVLPFGTVRSANIYGGEGIGINKNSSQVKKTAAWLFIVWATSPQVQIKIFLEEEGGNMPTRSSLNALIAAQYMVRLPQASAVITAGKKSYAYYRPKMQWGYEFENMIITHLKTMLKEDITADETARRMKKDWDRIRSTYE